jgi:hypothetical protein
MVRVTAKSKKVIEFTDKDGKLISFRTGCNTLKNKLCYAAVRKHGYIEEPKAPRVVKSPEEKRAAKIAASNLKKAEREVKKARKAASRVQKKLSAKKAKKYAQQTSASRVLRTDAARLLKANPDLMVRGRNAIFAGMKANPIFAEIRKKTMA